ncbi:MAG: DUF721 domain-containing protein [Planctomycetota bacterium]
MNDPRNRRRDPRGISKEAAKRRREPEAIEDILKRWLKANQARQRVSDREIFERWPDIVGEEIGAHTRVVDLRSGVLFVEVDSAPLLHELSTYFGTSLLESVRATECGESIGEIRFQAGSWG